MTPPMAPKGVPFTMVHHGVRHGTTVSSWYIPWGIPWGAYVLNGRLMEYSAGRHDPMGHRPSMGVVMCHGIHHGLTIGPMGGPMEYTPWDIPYGSSHV